MQDFIPFTIPMIRSLPQVNASEASPVIWPFTVENPVFTALSTFVIAPLTAFTIPLNTVETASPPISTVIPIILLATADTSFRKNGHKKSLGFSKHEKSTNHF